MNADEAQRMHELLCACLLGEASEEERARVEAALQASPELRAEHDRLAATIHLVRESFPSGEVLDEQSTQRLTQAAAGGQLGPQGASQGAPRRAPWYSSATLRIAASVAVLTGGYAALRSWSPGDGGSSDQVAQLEDPADAPAAAGSPDLRKSTAKSVDESGSDDLRGDPLASTARFARESADGSAFAAEGGKNQPAGEPRPEEEFQARFKNIQELGDELGATDRRVAGRRDQLEGLESLAQLGYAETDSKSKTTPSADRAGEAKDLYDGLDRRARAEQHLERQFELEVGAAADPALSERALEEVREVQNRIADKESVEAGRAGPTAPSSGPSGPPATARAPGGAASGVPGTRAGELATVTATPTGGGGGGGGPATPAPGPPQRDGAGVTGSDDFFLGQGKSEKKVGRADAGRKLARRERTAPDAGLRGLGYVGGEESDLGLVAGGGRGGGERPHPCELDRSHYGRHLTHDQREALIQVECRRLLDCCRRHPNETPAAMFFRFWGDNPFELVALDALSTFAVDVDTASYALARRYLREGHVPGKSQVRTEEFVNYFKPDIQPPLEGTFRVETELAPSRFGDSTKGHWMLRVGLRGREVSDAERKPLVLTFVVDTSGSMKENNRLELVKHALRLLVAQLGSTDSIAIVAFSNESRLVLPMTPAANRGVIEAAIFGLQPNGSTNAEAGLFMGYAEAVQHAAVQANNRVVFLSDGVANVGQTDQDRINEKIRGYRDQGIYLNTVGVGMGNHNDVFLEQLADKGDGICNYVDSQQEVQRALVENFTGAFEPIAKDVKIQVEFDAQSVYRYRLLGYENRAVADKDFRNDAVDAGEVGAGHQVVALYELELASPAPEARLATVRVRWLPPSGPGRESGGPAEGGATEIEQAVGFASGTSFEGASAGYRRSVIVAQFAELLRRSKYARGESLDDLLQEAARLAQSLRDPDYLEFVALVQTSRQLVAARLPVYDDLSRALDAVRHNHYLAAQLERLNQGDVAGRLEELETKNQEYEDLIRDLIRHHVEDESK